MKKEIVMIYGVLVLLIAACGNVDRIVPKEAKRKHLSSEMREYKKAFESAVESHDKDSVMALIHPDYVVEQHDQFLGGRTEQFIREFFGDDLNRIKKLKFIECYEWRNVTWVRYTIVTKEGELLDQVWSIKQRKDGSGFSCGLVGAVG